MILVLLDLTHALIADTAQAIEDGSIDGLDALARVMFAAALLEKTGEETAKPAEVPALSESWRSAQSIVADEMKILGDWLNEQIGPQEVLAQLNMLRPQLDDLLRTTDRELEGVYDVEAGMLEELRTQTTAEFIESLSDLDDPVAEPQSAGLNARNDSAFFDGTSYTIVGEVVNESLEPKGFVKIVASLYNQQDELIATEYSYSELDVVSVGGTSPFKIRITNSPAVSRYDLAVQGESEMLPDSQLKIVNDRTDVDGEWSSIIGEVQNDSNDIAEYVKVVATMYDAEGIVLDTDFAYCELDTVPPGSKAPFKMTFRANPDLDHYILQVQGD